MAQWDFIKCQNLTSLQQAQCAELSSVCSTGTLNDQHLPVNAFCNPFKLEMLHFQHTVNLWGNIFASWWPGAWTWCCNSQNTLQACRPQCSITILLCGCILYKIWGLIVHSTLPDTNYILEILCWQHHPEVGKPIELAIEVNVASAPSK